MTGESCQYMVLLQNIDSPEKVGRALLELVAGLWGACGILSYFGESQDYETICRAGDSPGKWYQ